MTRTLLTMACLPMLIGCGGVVEQLGKAQAAAVQARKAVTDTMDLQCLSIAKACPKPTASTRVSDCAAWVACDGKRHRLYQAAAGLQLSIRSALVVATLDPKQGAGLVATIVAQAARLWADVQRLGLLPTPSSRPGGGI